MKRFVFFIAFSGASMCYGQQDTLSGSDPLPAVVLKWHPLALIEPEQTLQLGVEYFISPHFSIQGEGGYIFNAYHLMRAVEVDGYKLRFQPRVHFPANPSSSFAKKNYWPVIYLGVDFFYNYTYRTDELEFGRLCANGACQYFEMLRYRVEKEAMGMHVLAGANMRASSRVIFDFYGGLGLRRVNEWLPEPLPNDVETRWRRGEGYDASLPSVMAGFKVGWMFYRGR